MAVLCLFSILEVDGAETFGMFSYHLNWIASAKGEVRCVEEKACPWHSLQEVLKFGWRFDDLLEMVVEPCLQSVFRAYLDHPVRSSVEGFRWSAP